MFALVLIVGMWLGYKMSGPAGKQINFYHNQTYLDELIQLVKIHYVDTLDDQVLYRYGIEGILKQLDPHTVFIPKDDLVRANEELDGSFSGIGIEFYTYQDSTTISSVIEGGPSEKLDIVAGDKIIKVNNDTIAGKKLDQEDIIKLIRGKSNSKITLHVLRLNNTYHSINIARGDVPIRSVSAYFMLDATNGFIRIDMFSETTYNEFIKALQALKEQGLQNLILDLRDNPGGYMDAATDIADELIAGEHTLVSTKGKLKNDNLVSHKNGLFETGKLCVLINEHSASASEILAGAIQDLDRGIIIGRRSFGKGLVQEQFQLPDGSAIRITTARYYLPSGRCIQKSFANGKEEYQHDIIDRFSNGQLQHRDTISNGKKVFYTSQNKKVYGDEGLIPEYFIPLDTTYHAILDDFYRNHVAEEFTFRYYYEHLTEFNSYQLDKPKIKDITLTDNIMKELKSFFKKQQLNDNILSNPTLLAEVKASLKIQFSRLIFGNNGRYKELYGKDAFVKKAMVIIKQE